MEEKSTVENDSKEQFRRLSQDVEKEMERLPVPGVVVGVYHDGEIYKDGFGITNVEHPLPVTEDTLFQIGSITKTFLATAVMRLVDMGKIDLDSPIRRYLPELKLKDEDAAQTVTMRHLLTHTGGWVGDYFNDLGIGDDALARMVAVMADLEQLTPLGEIWSYNNSGFYLAGRVIEVVQGTSFESAMKELVLDPLELEMSFFFAHEVITHRFAVGHTVIDKQPKVARPWAIGRAAHPAGGIISTVKDLIKYARFHMGDGSAEDGTRLLSPDSLALMQTPVLPSTGINMIGLSWMITDLGGIKMIAHSGGTNGQITNLIILPEKKFAAAVFTNSDQGRVLSPLVVSSALKYFLGLSMPQADPLEMGEEDLRQYTGRYESALSGCEITLKDGRLELQVTPKGGFPNPDSPPPPAPPPVRSALYAEDRIVILDEPMKEGRAEFIRDKDNNIAWFRLGSRLHAKKD
jgi:CubicO group peptidase (beta-lactamase class C family)